MRLINALILLLGRDCVCPEILILRGIPEHLWIFAGLRDSYAKSLPLPEEFRAPRAPVTVTLLRLYPGPGRRRGAPAPEALGHEYARGGGSSSQRGGSVWLLSPHTPTKEGRAAGAGETTVRSILGQTPPN